MKKSVTVLTALLMTLNMFAQAPESMSYQAVVRDANNNLVVNQTVGMEINILQQWSGGLNLVYTETQTPNTNDNGLISIEIGNDSVYSPLFQMINWNGGPFFIETKIDLTGGTNYTITATSQLLSVPYSLHSKKAESLVFGEQDPVFSSSIAGSITQSDTAYWNNKQDTLTAGAGIDIANNVISATHTSDTIITYSVGDFAQGGVVFWVDETGQHGLVCDPTPAFGHTWYAGTQGVTGAKGDGVYAGTNNTLMIIFAHKFSIGDDGNPYAASYCNDLVVTQNGISYGDWYLPSLEELSLLHANQSIVNQAIQNNLGSGYAINSWCWTSNEYNSHEAYLFNVSSGQNAIGHKSALGSSSTYTRAVRRF